MVKVLRLNTAAIQADYMTAMSKCLDEVAYGYFNSVVNQMRTESGKSDVTVEGEDKSDKLVRQIIGGAFAVLDSWGSGSLMDTSNPALNDYLSSEYYNPARSKTAAAPITGRPEGYYTDIFGEQQYSSGKMEGVNLEEAKNSPIKAQSPSGAFQDTSKWFEAEGTMIEAIDKATKEFFAGVLRNAGKYWKFGQDGD